MIKKFLHLIIVALTINVSVVTAQTVECFIIHPPTKYLQGVKKISILNFQDFEKSNWYSTYGGSAFTDYMAKELLNESRGIYAISGGFMSGSLQGKTYIKSSSINTFQLVEREQLNRVLNEKNLSSGVQLNDNQAAEVGKVLGIDALVTGTIKHDYKSNRTYANQQDGSTLYTTENICTSEITIKIISVATAQIMATETFSSVSSDKKSGTNEANVWIFDQLAPANLKNLAYKASCYIAPYFAHLTAEFQKIKVAEFKEKASQIKDYLKSDNLKSAYALYKAIYDADNYNADAAFNVGEMHYITGDYEEASKWYSIAAEIDSKTYNKIAEAGKSWAEYGKTLKELGINIEKYDFSSGGGDALADKVTTSGKKD